MTDSTTDKGDPAATTQALHPSSIIPGYNYPVRMSVDLEGHYLLAVFEGDISDTQVLVCIDQILEHNSSVIGMPCIVDFRESNLDALSTRGLIDLAELVEYWLVEIQSAQSAGIKIAILAGNDQAQDKADFYRRVSSPGIQQVRTFSEFESALKWVTLVEER